jgi:HSP20 family protein
MAIDLWRPRRSMARTRQESPYSGLTRLERQIGDIFDRFFEDFPTMGHTGMEGRMSAPALDVIDRKDEVVVRADLPGLERKDVEVEIQDSTLFLHGQRTEEKEEKDGDYYRSERWAGTFSRSVPLPGGLDTDQVNATFKNGVLEVHLRKTGESKGKRIEVKSS